MIKRIIIKLLRIFKIYFIFEKIDYCLIKFLSLHPVLASFYFMAFSREFDREHRATLQGILTYKQQKGLINNSHVTLRRNIHRLEKGLIMKNRRSVFATEYIQNTVAAFESALNNPSHDITEILWAHSILEKYFAIVTRTQKIEMAYQKYLPLLTQMNANNSAGQETGVFPGERPGPYEENLRTPSLITYSDFKQLCIHRRSVRWFQNQPVPREMIVKAISVASLAPSACNRQPFIFSILSDDLAKKAAGYAPGTAGYAENIPLLIVLIGDLSYYEKLRDKHLIYIDGSLAAMQFMLALETLGLASCPINWPDVDIVENKMTKLLKLKPYERPILLIAVGYAESTGQIPYSQKKPPVLLTRLYPQGKI